MDVLLSSASASAAARVDMCEQPQVRHSLAPLTRPGHLHSVAAEVELLQRRVQPQPLCQRSCPPVPNPVLSEIQHPQAAVAYAGSRAAEPQLGACVAYLSARVVAPDIF